MTQEMAIYQAGGHPAPRWTEDQKQLIKTAAMAKETTDDEFRLFLATADRLGLDPLARQIYAIHRRNKDGSKSMTIQTGIDGYRLMAARTGQLAGIDDPVYDTEAEDHPGKATVTVWRMVAGQRCPFVASARWSEYHQSYGKWGDMPYLMLGKCAEALALRKAFPAELSGVYTDDEMDQADRANSPTPVRMLSPHQQRATRPSPAVQADAVYSVGASKQQMQIELRRHGITTQAKADNLAQELCDCDWQHVREADLEKFEHWIAQHLLAEAEAQAPA